MIMRDVNNGWLIRYLHSNTASAFFFLVYFHIGRGLYYGSYRAPRTLVWVLGTVIFILMIVTAFLGYKRSPKWSNKKLSKNLIYRPFIRHYSTNSISNRSNAINNIIQDLGLNPVYIFDNIDKDTSRKDVLKLTSSLSGIYMIVNKITKDYYIGSASTNRFHARFSNHLIYFRGSKVVKAAVNKYGLNNFAFLILDLYPDVITKENNKELLNLEDKYLKLLLPNYNILTEAGSSFGYKHTEIDRLKMKEIFTDERREKIGSLNRGKNLTPETIEKMREKALNRMPMSEKTKLKCVAHTRPVVLYNLNGTVYGQYPTIIEAAKAINCNEKTLRRALTTEKKWVKKQWRIKDFNR
jgi:group I intron endonuclease